MIDPQESLWDVIVVGTGMGGATLGRALTAVGKTVLFLEKGGANPVMGPLGSAAGMDAEGRLHRGQWPNNLRRHDGQRAETIVPVIGCCVGGSTLFYAAALERFEPIDFVAAVDGSDHRVGWPLSYAQFEPAYAEAERLLEVRRSADDPASYDADDKLFERDLSEWDRQLITQTQAAGLQPRRLNVGFRYVPGCDECLGVICPRECKSDVRRLCIEPALRSGRAHLLDRCEVKRLLADEHRVTGVVAEVGGQERVFKARTYVLSAGALASPALLLQSKNEHWPNGLANKSGLVGRNLMFHISEIIAVFATTRFSRTARCKKSLSFRDYYQHDETRFGSVQSMGFDAGHGAIAAFLRIKAATLPLGTSFVVQKGLGLLARIVSRFMGNAGLFSTVVEDFPNVDNRIELDETSPGGVVIRYSVPQELKSRARTLRGLFAKAVKPWRVISISGSESPNFGHPCGTCRFGMDPASSVLDANNKAHDVENLFVVDASFMPTSAAVNPSLTVAANALRVADAVASSCR